MSGSLSQSISVYGYVFTFPLGLIGHIFSLITFSSKALRTTSTGLLFIFLTFSDIIYQLMSVRDFIVQVLQVPVVQSDDLCRFRTFILNFSTFTSAWILVLISMDRFIRVRFPYRQARLCTQKMAILSASIVCICSIAFTSHVLHSEFIVNRSMNNICGASRSTLTTYSIFYANIWPILQLFVTYFIPCCLMIMCLIGVYTKLRAQGNQFMRTTRRDKLQQQMLILMISSVICFAICTIPYSIHRVYYQRLGITLTTPTEIAILTIFLNVNYCFNFFIHCLTSRLFREKFIEQSKRILMLPKRQNNNTVLPINTINRQINITVHPINTTKRQM